MIDLQGLSAPFLMSWLGVWLFALLGGIGSGLIKVKDIDNRLFMPLITKPFIGTVSGVVAAVWLNGDADPPSMTLLVWAFAGSIFLTPIITGILVFISDQERQNEILNQAKDKYLPWTKSDKNDGGSS